MWVCTFCCSLSSKMRSNSQNNETRCQLIIYSLRQRLYPHAFLSRRKKLVRPAVVEISILVNSNGGSLTDITTDVSY